MDVHRGMKVEKWKGGGGLPGEKCDRQGQCEMNKINLKMGKLQVRLEEFK